jgi:asparagine synthase (glutamine-hydrolysing)
MCGVAGRVGANTGLLEPLKRMTDSIIHRGPDEEGFFVSPGVELGNRRLAIIDVSEGQQPISSEDGNIIVVFNGEIYNFQELRKYLIARGFRLKTHSDTEVIACLYQLEGIEFVHHLRGMFAIALWDVKKRELVLIRDRLGKKPLLYRHRSDGGLDFASESRALLLAGARREPDMVALDFVLTFGYAPAPMTGFSSISSLAPGHYLTWKDDKIRTEQYWKFDSSKKTIFRIEDAISQTNETLEESVRLRLISERPIGVLLSGGVDSTLVTAYAAKNHDSTLNTFSIGFDDPKFDESSYAAQVAKHLGTEHHQLIVKPDPILLVETMAKTLDRPFADSSILPTYLVSEFARSQVVVAIGGDGGDEAYGGYSRYQIVDRMQHLNPLLRLARPVLPALESLAFRSGNQKISRLVGGLRSYPSEQERYLALVSLIHQKEREKLWRGTSSTGNSRPDPAAWFKGIWEGSHSGGKLDRPLAVDIETYLPEDLNYKTDMASMANSLELRSPFQDHKLVELSGRIASNLKFKDGQTKYILRQMAKEFVPGSLVDRKKMGFGIPRGSWMRNELRPLVADVLLGSASRNREWFNIDEVSRQIDLHNRGLDRDRILWPLFAIEMWAQNWLD